MNPLPSYKVIVPIAAVYALLLYVPTIDALAMIQWSFFSYHMKFSIAVLILPAIFPIADSITEVYNKKIAYYVVFSSYVSIISMSFLQYFLLSHSQNKSLSNFMLAPSIIVTIAGTVSYVVTAYFNIHLLNKLKIKMRARHFILRSLICSSISGLLMSLLVQCALNYKTGFSNSLNIVLSSFIIKLLVTIPFVYLAKFLVVLYRYVDKIECESFNKNLLLNSN